MPPYDEYIEKIKPLWESAWLTNMGVLHKEFEKRLKEYLNIDKISLMNNGHMALELTIQAMNLTGEVITTPFTFISTTHAIVRNGLTPVFCDINPNNYVIDSEKIEELINERTSAILPVHVFGQVCDIEKIDDIAKRHNLKVIYDAAHTFGEQYNGKSVVDYGDASILSFHATKVFNTIEGGASIYHNDTIGEELYKLKNFGIKSETIIDGVGANAKMDEFRAAMGICNLDHIDSEIAKRKIIFEHYHKRLDNIEGIKLIQIQKNVKGNYGYFPIVFDKEILGFSREYIHDELIKHNIYTRRYFYPITTMTECYQKKFSSANTPIAKYISENILTFPIYADLSLELVDYICDIVEKICKDK